MFIRVIVYLLMQISCVVFVYWLDVRYQHFIVVALAAALAGTYVWFVMDLTRYQRVIRWLRSDGETPYRGWGAWSVVVMRVEKILRVRDKKTEEAQKKLEEFLSAIQASPIGMVLLNGAGQIEWFNQTAAQHFGLDATKDYMQHFTNLVRDPVYLAYFQKKDFSSDILMPCRSIGGAKEVVLSVNLHRYAAGKKYLLLSRDVTMIQRAEEMRRDFVANVSHELRTPLTVLAGFVETMKTIPIDSASTDRYLTLMEKQTRRMENLVSDLLTLSLLEDSPLPLFNHWFDLDDLLTQCGEEAHQLAITLRKSESDVTIKQEGRVVQLAGNHTEIHSAFSNLIANAIRHTPPGKGIVIAWHLHEDDSGTFSVTDQGEGIAKEHLSRLTERFYRVDKGRSRNTGGTGLGLAIVKHVCQRHGAKLNISSVLGEGATFSIHFPANRVKMGDASATN